MEHRGRAARRPLIDLVAAARGGDVEAATAMVAICRPELLRLARSGDPATAEQLVDGLLVDFIGQLPHVRFEATAEVWTHLYGRCRQRMGAGPTDQQPEVASPVEPIETIEPTGLEELRSPVAIPPLVGGLPDDGMDQIPLVVQPTRRPQPSVPSLKDRVQDGVVEVLWARRSGIAGGLVMGSVLALALAVVPRLGGPDPLNDVAFAAPGPQISSEGTAEESPNLASARRTDDDGRRAIFGPSSDPTVGPDLDPDGPTSSSIPDPNSSTSTSTSTRAPDGPATSSATTVVSPGSTIRVPSTTGRVTSAATTPTASGTTPSSIPTSASSTTVARPASTSSTRRPTPSTATTAVAIAYTCGSVTGTVEQLEAAGYQVTIGTAGADIIDLRGATGPQFVRGEGGSDQILTGGGADVICGGDGADVIDGGLGNDVIDGGGGDDVLYGRAGSDVLTGGVGADTIFGGSGSDTIRGGRGNDRLLGGTGTDDIDDDVDDI